MALICFHTAFKDAVSLKFKNSVKLARRIKLYLILEFKFDFIQFDVVPAHGTLVLARCVKDLARKRRLKCGLIYIPFFGAIFVVASNQISS